LLVHPLHKVATEAEKAAAAEAAAEMDRQLEALKGLSVVISGATGNNSGSINGVFAPTAEVYNGKPLFQKVCDPEKWLLYTKNDYWVVSNTVGKEANDGTGRCISVEFGLAHPTMATAWEVVQDGVFVAEAGMSVTVSPLYS